MVYVSKCMRLRDLEGYPVSVCYRPSESGSRKLDEYKEEVLRHLEELKLFGYNIANVIEAPSEYICPVSLVSLPHLSFTIVNVPPGGVLFTVILAKVMKYDRWVKHAFIASYIMCGASPYDYDCIRKVVEFFRTFRRELDGWLLYVLQCRPGDAECLKALERMKLLLPDRYKVLIEEIKGGALESKGIMALVPLWKRYGEYEIARARLIKNIAEYVRRGWPIHHVAGTIGEIAEIQGYKKFLERSALKAFAKEFRFWAGVNPAINVALTVVVDLVFGAAPAELFFDLIATIIIEAATWGVPVIIRALRTSWPGEFPPQILRSVTRVEALEAIAAVIARIMGGIIIDICPVFVICFPPYCMPIPPEERMV